MAQPIAAALLPKIRPQVTIQAAPAAPTGSRIRALNLRPRTAPNRNAAIASIGIMVPAIFTPLVGPLPYENVN
jgi:hypothetical protein